MDVIDYLIRNSGEYLYNAEKFDELALPKFDSSTW